MKRIFLTLFVASSAILVLSGPVLASTRKSQNLDRSLEEHDRNPNVIILTPELDREIGNSLVNEARKTAGVRLKRNEVDDAGNKKVVYSYSNVSHRLEKKVNDILDKKTSQDNTTNISPASLSTSGTKYCARYYDYIYWLGSSLSACGYSGQKVYIPRLSAYSWGNDDITSLFHSHSQIYTYLYEHDYYGGWRYGTGWDRAYIGWPYNNNASSLKVFFP